MFIIYYRARIPGFLEDKKKMKNITNHKKWNISKQTSKQSRYIPSNS